MENTVIGRGEKKMKKKKDDWFDEHIIVVGNDAKANKAVKAKIKEDLMRSRVFLKKEGKIKKYCMVSTTGDLAIGGIGTYNTVIPFDNKYFPVVKEFLIKQEIWHISSLELYYDPERKLDHIKNDFMEYMRACQNLTESGIFTNKYKSRTEWRLVLNTESELEFYKPYKIDNNKQEEEVK